MKPALALLRRAALALLLAGPALLLPVASAVPAAAQQVEGWAYELANELMSPYCPGRALSECPSPQAEDLRAWIVAQERAGRQRAEVEAQLYARFGDELRQAPRAEGMGLLAYVVPAGLTLAGGLVVGAFFVHVRRRGRSREPGEPDPPEPEDKPDAAPPVLDPELMRQVDEELARGEDERGA